MSTEKSPKDPRRAIIDLLDELRDGEAIIDASEALTKLLVQVRDRCEPGSLTIKINLKPATSGKILAITDEITVKAPKAKSEATLMFCDKDGMLSNDNQEQGRLPLHEAPRDNRPVVEAPAPIANEPITLLKKTA